MVIVCDCHYRSAITAIRLFHNENEEIIAVTTDIHKKPPSFFSKYVKEKFIFPSDKASYTKELLSLCEKYDSPIIFPVGNFTLNVLSENAESFEKIARICVASPDSLRKLNDKKWVKNEAQKFGIKVPRQYTYDSVDSFPVVVKPFCGEEFNLKASERYRIVYNQEQLEQAYDFFKKFDNEPIIEEYIDGYGVGVSFVINRDFKAQTAFCHKRLIEYPLSGGPSACLETFFDEALVCNTKNFLENINFSGIAMVEYKCAKNGYRLLEINPRVWGSFPSTEKANSDFIKAYIRACYAEKSEFTHNYDYNKKVKFLRGLIMAFLSSLKQKNFKKSLSIANIIISPFVPDATFNVKDIIPSILDFFRR